MPKGAGKGAAMEYVRAKLGFPLESTVACGDSNNDLLMLNAVGRERRMALVVLGGLCTAGG